MNNKEDMEQKDLKNQVLDKEKKYKKEIDKLVAEIKKINAKKDANKYLKEIPTHSDDELLKFTTMPDSKYWKINQEGNLNSTFGNAKLGIPFTLNSDIFKDKIPSQKEEIFKKELVKISAYPYYVDSKTKILGLNQHLDNPNIYFSGNPEYCYYHERKSGGVLEKARKRLSGSDKLSNSYFEELTCLKKAIEDRIIAEKAFQERVKFPDVVTNVKIEKKDEIVANNDVVTNDEIVTSKVFKK